MATSFRVPEGRDHLVALAQLAEQAERYDEMAVAMRRLCRTNTDVTSEELQLLAVAYKHLVTSRRASWRVACSVEQAEERQRTAQLPLARNYRKQIENEIVEVCQDLLHLLDRNLLPTAVTEESKVLIYRLQGDYYRYLAEISLNDAERDQAHEAYTKATEYAAGLRPLSPVRLSLALNFAIFYYEVLKSPDKACQLARQAYEDAVGEDDDLDEEQRREAAVVLQLLRDNLFLWTERDDAGEGAEQ
jgi:14-3-3 protein epsilon